MMAYYKQESVKITSILLSYPERRPIINKFILVIILLILQASLPLAADEDSAWTKIWGTPTEPLTIIPDMFSYHLLFLTGGDSQGHDSNNPALAVVYKGIFAGTFINTYNKRSYAFGIQRYWFEKSFSNDVTYDLGYRLGLIYGYQDTGRYDSITRHQPFLPFPQLISDLTWKNIGWEVAYTSNVISTSIYFRF